MTVAQYPYRDVDPSAGGLGLMPYLPITLTVGEVSVSDEGLVDSGAALKRIALGTGVATRIHLGTTNGSASFAR